MRAARRYGLEEIGEPFKAVVLGGLVREAQLGLVVGVLVDLAVIELGDADRLRSFKQRPNTFSFD